MKKAAVILFLSFMAILHLSTGCEKVTNPFSRDKGEIVDQRDGKKYNWVKIGDQIWFAENLNIGSMIDGSMAMTNNNKIEKYCIDNNYNNCKELGGLYQWNEMMNYDTIENTQGICPQGWHIPTDSEWIVLESYVDLLPDSVDIDWLNIGYRGLMAGKYLKSKSKWVNQDGEDKFGFNAYGAGVRVNEADYFGDVNKLGYYWTSSLYNNFSENLAFQRILDFSRNDINRQDGAFRSGRSVRCIKD